MKNTVKKQVTQSEYFDGLPQSTQDIVRDAILGCASNKQGPDCYKLDEDAIELIECHSRSGFIPHSWNKGGLDYNNFTDLMGYWGGGYSVTHKAAQKEIERQIDYSLECALESFKDSHSEEIKGIPADKLNYHDLYEMGLGNLAEKLSTCESESLSDEQSSIMHSIRFMFHGVDDDGNYSASVSCAVNTEGPYHRQSISWAPAIFCEGASEVEITWKTDKQLKTKLTKALKDTSGKVF
jgi:hypothetical protein